MQGFALYSLCLTKELTECNTLFMDPAVTPDVTPEPNKKKIILILAGFGLFLLIVMAVLLSLTSSSKTPVATVPSTKSAEKNTESNNGNVTTPVPVTSTAVDSWKDFKNVLFSIKYPPTWNESESLANGTYLVLQPPLIRTGESGHVAVEINDSNRVSVASMSAGLKVLGFRKEIATVAGIQAQKFSGTIKFPGKIIHNTAYLFGNNGKVYFIKLSYQQVEIDSVLEQEFVKIVSSFTFR